MQLNYTDAIGVRQDILITNDSVNSKYDVHSVIWTKDAERTVVGVVPTFEILPDCTVVEDIRVIEVDTYTPHATADLPFVSPVYIPHTEGSIEIWAGASLVKAKRPPKHVLRVGADRGSAGKRGKIASFSKAARWRMMQKVAKVRNDALPTFLTLTYPAEYAHDSATWKRDLDVFLKRMKRKFPLSGGMWKLEPQKRGAPHFHLFIWGVDRFVLQIWASVAWFEVVGSDSRYHKERGAYVSSDRGQMHSWRQVKIYLTKYFTKLPDKEIVEGWEYPGRWWGVFTPDNIPWGECIKVGLPLAESKLIIRTMRKLIKIKGRHFESLTCIVESASWWFENLDRLTYRAV